MAPREPDDLHVKPFVDKRDKALRALAGAIIAHGKPIVREGRLYRVENEQLIVQAVDVVG